MVKESAKKKIRMKILSDRSASEQGVTSLVHANGSMSTTIKCEGKMRSKMVESDHIERDVFEKSDPQTYIFVNLAA